jgi:3-deoxy-manno-octulosonate cytidylyltransferase (CMP-KDO synthetase)
LGKAAGIIPVRYQSSRFPGKPLALILGKPMIQWVYEGACRSRRLDRVLIATDDARICETASGFGAEVVMTRAGHASGTERVAEAAAPLDASIIINVQGDEPLIEGAMLDSLVEALGDPAASMATLMARVKEMELLRDPNTVKVIADKDGWALYFSRAPIPCGASDYFFQHIGIYAYRKNFLIGFHLLPKSRLECIEKLEQLRVLENGLKIKMVEISHPTLSVDTPQDIIKVESSLKAKTQ